MTTTKQLISGFMGVFLAFLLLLAAPAMAEPQRYDVRVGGMNRYYEISVPQGLANYPLMLVFHGGLGTPEDIQEMTGLESFAQANGFAVAFMAGTGRTKSFLVWNAGGCCASAVEDRVDDVAYVQAAIAQIASNFPIDSRRIYLAGFSNGGMLVNRLADQLAGQITAAIIVGGPRFKPVPTGLPVPIIFMQATRDPVVPFNGGYSDKRIVRKAQSMPFMPITEGVQSWVTRNRCQQSSALQFHGYQVLDYTGCDGDAAISYVIVDSDDHAWFGGAKAPNAPVNASELGWSFVSRFSR